MENQSTNKLSAKPLLMLVYHFAPSREIGARRITACAKDLVEHGIPVVAVSAFGNVEPVANAPNDSIGRVWVEAREPWMLKSLVSVKRSLTSLFRRPRKADAASSAGVPSLEGGPAVAVKSWLIARIAMLVDAEKNWSMRAALRARSVASAHRPIAVMASGPPNSTIVAAHYLARSLSVPLIVDLRDPWLTGSKWEVEANESMEAHVGRFLESRAFKYATLICVATDGMASRLREAYPQFSGKTYVVQNGFDGEPSEPKTDTGKRLNFLFAGEIYVNRDPFPFLAAIERLLQRNDVDKSRVGVTIVGRSEPQVASALNEWVAARGWEAIVRILPPVPFSEVQQMTAEATVLVNLAQKASVMIPAKAYEHVASGREVLLISERTTDVFKMFEPIAGVWCVDSGDAGRLDLTLQDLYQRHVVEGRASPPSVAEARTFSRASQQQIFRSLLAKHGITSSNSSQYSSNSTSSIQGSTKI